MELFQVTLFFMLSFFLVIAFQVARNRRSTILINHKGRELWLLSSKLSPNKRERLIAYLEQPGFTFGPYIWVSIETNDSAEIVSLVEELEDY